MGSHDEIEELAAEIGKSLNVKEKSELEILAEIIESGKAKNIMVLSGAGVSVAAGIPDFRTPGTGLYDNLQKYDLPSPQAIFDVEYYREKPGAFCMLAQELWPGLRNSPTLTHSFLKLLSEKGLLLRNYTQNIDGLEFLAGLPAEELVECHGHFRTSSCIDCHKASDSQVVKDTIVKKGETPVCKRCGGYVKPDIVFFGESLPDRFEQLLRQDLKKADLLLVMGTSLQVAPVSMIPSWVRCNRVLFNRELSMNIRSGDLFVEGDCDTNVEKLCSLLGWKEDLLAQNAKARIKEGKKNDKEEACEAEEKLKDEENSN